MAMAFMGVACGSDPGPGVEEYKSELARSLERRVEVQTFEILSSKTKEKSRVLEIEVRFKATTLLSEALYVPAKAPKAREEVEERFSEIQFFSESAPKHASQVVSGTVVSVRNEEQWRLRFVLKEKLTWEGEDLETITQESSRLVRLRGTDADIETTREIEDILAAEKILFDEETEENQLQLVEWAMSGPVLLGDATHGKSRKEKTPVKMQLEFSEDLKSVTGLVRWPGMGSLARIAGTAEFLTDKRTIRFREIEVLADTARGDGFRYVLEQERDLETNRWDHEWRGRYEVGGLPVSVKIAGVMTVASVEDVPLISSDILFETETLAKLRQDGPVVFSTTTDHFTSDNVGNARISLMLTPDGEVSLTYNGKPLPVNNLDLEGGSVRFESEKVDSRWGRSLVRLYSYRFVLSSLNDKIVLAGRWIGEGTRKDDGQIEGPDRRGESYRLANVGVHGVILKLESEHRREIPSMPATLGLNK